MKSESQVIKVVLDTNNLISAQISKKGYSAKVYDLWEKNQIKLFTSSFQLKELAKVLEYPRIKKKYNLTGAKIAQIIKTLKDQAKIVYPLVVPETIKRDFSDNQILAIAQEGKVDFVVSGDEHLLSVKNFKNIPIITAREFLEKIIPASTKQL